MASFNIENISKKDKRILQRMTGVDFPTGERLKQGIESSREASARISSGETRTSESGERTKTKPSARNTPEGRAADKNFRKKLELDTPQGAAANQQFNLDTKSDVKLKRPTSSSPKISSAFADLSKKVDKVKSPVPSKRGSLSTQVAPILKDLRKQGELERRMSAGYDKTLARKGEEVLKQIRTTKSKPTAVKQSDVSKRAEKFRQSFGTSTDIQQVIVKDITPSRGVSSSTKALPPARTTSPSVTPTKTKLKLPKLKLTTASVKPTPSRSVPTTAGQNLEFGKTKTGSFTYKPSTKAPTTTAVPAKPAPTGKLKPPASPTIRRRSGNAGPSSKLDSKPLKRSVTTSKPTTSVDLGRPNQSRPRQDSVSYRPGKKNKNPSIKSGALSMAGDVAYGGLVGYDAYKKAKARGQTDAYAYKQAAAQGGSVATASAAGGAIGRKLGSKAPGWTKMIAAPAGDILGSAVGGYLAQTASPGIVGASKTDKKWMQRANRSVQQGIPAQSATSKSGNRAIVRDAKGKERVGYRAYKDGKTVYKHGNDPSSLQYTSSNPLERIGRTVGSSGGLGPISDLVKGYYSRKDTATRTANVAAQRSRASK